MSKKPAGGAGGGPVPGAAGPSMISELGAEKLPHAEVLPAAARRQRRRSSISREHTFTVMKELPLLKDVPSEGREDLFREKLKLCCVMFNFDDAESNKKGKEMKRVTLLEIVDFVNGSSGQKMFTEEMMPFILDMVTVNVFRTLPPSTDEFDPEEDEPVLESSWPHLQVVYEFLLRFVVSAEVKSKAAKKFVDQKFCLQLLELFDSEDPRERDYLKTILHRIYGKFMNHRSFIRKAIANVFFRFVFETGRHNGISELLEILGSIINGFALPLKEEHTTFLERALIPLHRPKGVALFQQQLTYCVIQFVEKDLNTAVPIILGLIRTWPWSNSAKQVLFLNELEEILEFIGGEQLDAVYVPLFRCIAKCVGSAHFQVAERALFLWNNDQLLTSGCLSRAYSAKILPLLYPALLQNSTSHWNPTVESLALNVLKHFQETDPALFDRVVADAAREAEERERVREERAKQWEEIEALAAAEAARLGIPVDGD